MNLGLCSSDFHAVIVMMVLKIRLSFLLLVVFTIFATKYDLFFTFARGFSAKKRKIIQNKTLRFWKKNISKLGNVAIAQETIERKSSKSKALQMVCICSPLIMIFFQLFSNFLNFVTGRKLYTQFRLLLINSQDCIP